MPEPRPEVCGHGCEPEVSSLVSWSRVTTQLLNSYVCEEITSLDLKSLVVVSFRSEEWIHSSRSLRCSIINHLVCPDSEMSGPMSKPRPSHHGCELQVSSLGSWC